MVKTRLSDHRPIRGGVPLVREGSYLNNLWIALMRRFERTGSTEGVDRAIDTIKQAVEFMPVDHPDRAMYLSDLGGALQERFQRTG